MRRKGVCEIASVLVVAEDEQGVIYIMKILNLKMKLLAVKFENLWFRRFLKKQDK